MHLCQAQREASVGYPNVDYVNPDIQVNLEAFDVEI